MHYDLKKFNYHFINNYYDKLYHTTIISITADETFVYLDDKKAYFHINFIIKEYFLHSF